MKSKANIKGHPIHPILIPFPIAFFTVTVAADIIAALYPGTDLSFIKLLHLGGIAGAIVAAIPGIIDYSKTVPPNSSAKKRATKHGLLNTSMLLLFSIAYYLRINESVDYLLLLEIPAFILMLTAGWLGGTMVYRNLIGVDMRYADAGKWKEEYISQENGIAELCGTAELNVDQMKLFHINGKRIVIAKTSSSYVAFDDRCSHKGGSLAGGTLICGTVQCPWHGSQFDVENGQVKAGPAKEKIATYPLIFKDNKIFIDVAKTN